MSLGGLQREHVSLCHVTNVDERKSEIDNNRKKHTESNNHRANIKIRRVIERRSNRNRRLQQKILALSRSKNFPPKNFFARGGALWTYIDGDEVKNVSLMFVDKIESRLLGETLWQEIRISLLGTFRIPIILEERAIPMKPVRIQKKQQTQNRTAGTGKTSCASRWWTFNVPLRKLWGVDSHLLSQRPTRSTQRAWPIWPCRHFATHSTFHQRQVSTIHQIPKKRISGLWGVKDVGVEKKSFCGVRWGRFWDLILSYEMGMPHE